MPEYKQFTEEPKAKRNRRHKKYAREAVEAEAIKRDMEKKSKQQNGNSLEQQIMKRQSERESAANSFFDRLMEKYGGIDDSEEYELPAKKMKKVISKKTSAANSKTNKVPTKETLNKVKNGRVKKTK